MSPARSDSTPSRSRSASSSLRSASAARLPNSLSSIARQPFQGVARQPEGLPLRQHPGTEAAVEFDGWRVPLEHLPVQPPALLPHGDPRQLDEQALSDALASEPGADEEVLQVHPPAAQPGGVGVEIEGEAGRRELPLRHQAEVPGRGAEPVRQEVLLGGHHRMWLLLVLRELANELEDLGHVSRLRLPDDEHERGTYTRQRVLAHRELQRPLLWTRSEEHTSELQS